MNWVMPSDQRGGSAEIKDLTAYGVPTIDEAVAQYCKATGREGLPNLDWYFSYNLFRLAGICQGIVGRVRDGTAASAHAELMEARVPVLARGLGSSPRRPGPRRLTLAPTDRFAIVFPHRGKRRRRRRGARSSAPMGADEAA